MRNRAAAISFSIIAASLSGCAAPLAPQQSVVFQNPTFVAVADRDFVWDQLVNVVDDYFKIEREERVRLVGDVLTEGRIETYPEVGATWLEPWRRDSVGDYARTESTLQTIRRTASIRVLPEQGGFLVDVTVFKELEDLLRPEGSTVGAATFRNDGSLERYSEPVGGYTPTIGWIPQGRDTLLEQRIIAQLQTNLGHSGPIAAHGNPWPALPGH